MEEPKAKWPGAWAIGVPALVALAIYVRAGWLGLSWDDAALVVDNPNLGSLHGLFHSWTEETFKASGLDEQTGYYRPLALTSFWLVAHVGAIAAQHLANVAIHAVNATLVARVLVKRVGATLLTACLVASFWAAATSGSEVVLWVSGRFDALATTFLLVAFLANGARTTRLRALAPAAFAAALLTKELALPWFLVLVLDDLMLLRRSQRESWRRWALLLALSIAAVLARRAVGMQSDAGLGHALSWAFPALASIATRVFARLVVPIGLDPLQPLALLGWPATLAVLALLAGLGFMAARKGRDAASPASAMLVGLAWFVVVLLPLCAIPPSEPVAGDRYGYAASVGLMLVLAAAIGSLRGAPALRAAHAGVALLALVNVVLTELHIPAWKDRESIARSMAETHPESAHAHYLLGYLALERNDLPAAEEHLARSLALSRSWRTLDAECVLELRRGKLDDAAEACVASAAIAPNNPRVWLNLASVYVKEKRWEDALAAAERAVALKPRYPEAHYLGGIAAANLGRFDLANAHADAGLAVEPDNARLRGLKTELARRQPR